jgi:hypothetical protein
MTARYYKAGDIRDSGAGHWRPSWPKNTSACVGKQRKTRENMAETAYCVKCHDKREMKDTQQITMKNGKPALQGLCTVCGTKINKILPGKAKVAGKA